MFESVEETSSTVLDDASLALRIANTVTTAAMMQQMITEQSPAKQRNSVLINREHNEHLTQIRNGSMNQREKKREIITNRYVLQQLLC